MARKDEIILKVSADATREKLIASALADHPEDLEAAKYIVDRAVTALIAKGPEGKRLRR